MTNQEFDQFIENQLELERTAFIDWCSGLIKQYCDAPIEKAGEAAGYIFDAVSPLYKKKLISSHGGDIALKPYEKFLFVEDGSVFTDELETSLMLNNPEIKLIVYRQGAPKPELVDIK